MPRNSYRRTCSWLCSRRAEKRRKGLSREDSKASLVSAAVEEEEGELSSVSILGVVVIVVGVVGRERVSYSASR